MAVEGIGGVSPTVVTPAPQVTATVSTPRKVEQPEAVVKNKAQSNAPETVPNSTQNNNGEAATNEKIRKAVEQLNSSLGKTECRYSFHDDTNRVMIRLVDKESEEVIKEFPAEDTLNMIAKAWELAGLLVDEKL